MSNRLRGKQRETMLEFIRGPLAIWMETTMAAMFPLPEGAEACDIMAEAIVLAANDVFCKTPYGKPALDHMLHEIELMKETV